MKQLNLIASWKDSQQSMAKDDPTKVSGAFLTIEKDQSMFDPKDAKDGKADPNPYLESHKVKGDRGEFTSHTVWYSKSQMDMMMNAGQTVKQADGRNAIAFKADVQKSTDPKTKVSRMIVLTPKDPAKAQGDKAELAKIEKYNDMHPMGPSDNQAFDENTLAKQAGITKIAKESRDAKYLAKVAQTDLTAEAALSEPSL